MTETMKFAIKGGMNAPPEGILVDAYELEIPGLIICALTEFRYSVTHIPTGLQVWAVSWDWWDDELVPLPTVRACATAAQDLHPVDWENWELERDREQGIKWVKSAQDILAGFEKEQWERRHD